MERKTCPLDRVSASQDPRDGDRYTGGWSAEAEVGPAVCTSLENLREWFVEGTERMCDTRKQMKTCAAWSATMSLC